MWEQTGGLKQSEDDENELTWRILDKNFVSKTHLIIRGGGEIQDIFSRVHYDLEGMKYIIQIYEGEINGHGEKERLPEEFQYEFEQEMLKHIHDLKKELREKGWTQRDLPPEVHQPSFLRGDESDAQLGFTFEWIYLADNAQKSSITTNLCIIV